MNINKTRVITMVRLILFFSLIVFPLYSCAQVLTCSGEIKTSNDHHIDFSQIHVQLVTRQGVVKETSECAPNNGYFLIPVYDKGEYLIRIAPPNGWKFSPSEVSANIDGTNDVCSKGQDIVFTFIGYSLTGQVLTVGHDKGPAGVTVTLLTHDTKSVVKKTLSGQEGRYVLDDVLPGQYEIQGSHPVWKISKDVVNIEVGANSLNVPKGAITVQGFDVKGHIESKGEAVAGVQFLLHPLTQSKVSCDSVSSEGVCLAVSGEGGIFSFTSLPPGEYKLVPHYERADSKFQVFPTQLSFTVTNDSLTIEPKFEVHGFTIFGSVLTSKNGRGLEGAKVNLGGSLQTVTDKEGHYQFNNISTGTYTLKVSVKSLHFDPVALEINPSSPRLPDIFPSRYSVCGHVTITFHHPKTQFKTDSCTVELVSDLKVLETKKIISNGKFCFMLLPGEYKMRVGVSPEAEKLGLSFSPAVLPVNVLSESINDINFIQYVPSLSGSIHCLHKCKQVDVHLVAIATGHKVTTKVSGFRDKGKFEFKQVLPGKYKVSVGKELLWCWDREEVSITIPSSSSQSPPEISFNQTGVQLNIQSSHIIEMDIYEGADYSFRLPIKKGNNKHCLERIGQFSLVPYSCHKFPEDMFLFVTDAPDVITVKAIKHTVNISVYAPNDSEPVQLGLKTSRTIKSLKPYLSSTETPPTTIHHYSFVEKPGTSLTLTPQTNDLLCSPDQLIHVVGKDCPEVLTPIHCRRGSFISGHVEPPLVGVAITIATETGDIKVTTDDKGEYRVGPLANTEQYTIEASYEGYVFEALEDDPYSFKAMKKSQLVIKANDGTGPLVGVFVSLSGDGVRNSSTTNSEGSVVYKDISPGQYYIKPLLREYEFQPPSKVITLLQGDTVNVDFVAKRVAFSSTGKVYSLNGTPLESVSVELTGQGESSTCNGYKDTTSTDSKGVYRFRGLQPNCDYLLSLVSDTVVERGLPLNQIITLTQGDIEGGDFIAILRNNKVFITGNVIINDQDLLGHVKVTLYSDKYLESQVSSIPVDPAGFYHFPALIFNPSKMYYVQVETSLSSQSYTITIEPSNVAFIADKNRHFTFNMTVESIPLVNGNAFRGSFVGIFVAIASLFFLANIDKIIKAVQYSRGSSKRQY